MPLKLALQELANGKMRHPVYEVLSFCFFKYIKSKILLLKYLDIKVILNLYFQLLFNVTIYQLVNNLFIKFEKYCIPLGDMKNY